jgi:aryl-alcohol dehydrogenase-like predicted oxidoreductase
MVSIYHISRPQPRNARGSAVLPAFGLDGSRFTIGTAAKTYTERYWREREFATVDAFVTLAADSGAAPATLALAWVLAHPAITAPLVGASRPEQLGASAAAVDFRLDPVLKARLDELTHEYRMGDAAR